MFTSNISGVIARLKRLEAGLPEVVQRAIAPAAWLPQLRTIANQVLVSEAQTVANEPRRNALLAVIPAIVETLIGYKEFTNTVFELSARTGVMLDVGIQYGLPTLGAVTEALQIPEDQMNDFRQKVYDWVDEQKDWDISRDGEKTIENIAEKAEWIVDVLTTPTLASPMEQAARDSFLQSVNPDGLLAAISGVVPVGAPQPDMGALDRETARAWLGLVLDAWKKLVILELPIKLREELARLNHNVSHELI